MRVIGPRPGRRPGARQAVLIDVELPPGSAAGPPIDRRELARRGVGAGVPGLHRRSHGHLATGENAGRDPPLQVPHVGAEPGRLSGADEGRSPAAGVRCEGPGKAYPGSDRQPLGGPAGHRDRGPSGGRPRRPPGLADRSDSRGRESDLTVYQKTCKSLQGTKSVYADSSGGKGRGAGR